MKKTYIILGLILIVTVICGRMVTTNIAEARNEKLQTALEKESVKQQQEEKLYNDMINRLTNWVYGQSSKVPKSFANEIVIFIYENCEYPKIILGIFSEESDFDIFAYRPDTKVYGLGQIKYDVWSNELKSVGIKEARDLYDWRLNVLATNYIFNKYYKQTKNLDKALSKYVGEINTDMQKYRANILSHIGSLSLIEGEMIKFMIRNKRLYQITQQQIEVLEETKINQEIVVKDPEVIIQKP
jgi:hypothetical protein